MKVYQKRKKESKCSNNKECSSFKGQNKEKKDENEMDIKNKDKKNSSKNKQLLNKKKYRENIKEKNKEKEENNSENDEIEEYEEKSDKNEDVNSENDEIEGCEEKNKEDSESNEDAEGEENNDDESEEEANFINLFKSLKGKEKWYCKKKNVPEPKYELAKNTLAQLLNEQVNSEIVTMLQLEETFNSPYSTNYVDIKKLNNDYFFILFDNIFYCINSTKFKILNNNESLQKYFGKENNLFSNFEQINDELIGIISSDFLLIVKYDNKEVTFFQEIPIKASIFKSFPSENLIMISENIQEKEKCFNILYYYIYNEKDSQYQLQKKEEIDFSKFGEEIKNFCCYFNLIGNIKKLKNGKILLFTISTIVFEEKQNFDDFYRSFYERDCEIFLNIYFYDNKELSLIYNNNYLQHFIYDNDFFKSDFDKILKFFNDRNIRINEENKEIYFFIPYLQREILFNYETKKRKHKQFEKSVLKYNYFYDDKSKLYFFERTNCIDQQMISVFDSNKLPIKHVFSPYYFSEFIPLKKGYLLGVVKNTLTVYSFYAHLNRYAPSKTVLTNVCLLKY